jgi:hypothetical protein
LLAAVAAQVDIAQVVLALVDILRKVTCICLREA